MPEPQRLCQCQCRRLPGHPCIAKITQEDLLCDACRNKKGCAAVSTCGVTLHVAVTWPPLRPGFPQ